MVGRAQRLFGIELHPAREVDEGEEQVADLVQSFLIGRGLAELFQFFANLLPHAGDLLPVPSEGGRALLDLPARRESGKGARDTAEGTGVGLAPFLALGRLDRFPGRHELLDAVDLQLTEDMRMTAHDLAGNGSIDVGEIEGA